MWVERVPLCFLCIFFVCPVLRPLVHCFAAHSRHSFLLARFLSLLPLFVCVSLFPLVCFRFGWRLRLPTSGPAMA